MSDSNRPPMRRTKSGETPIAIAFRKKLDSIREGTLPHLEELNRQAEALKEKHASDAPPEDEDPKKEEDQTHDDVPDDDDDDPGPD